MGRTVGSIPATAASPERQEEAVAKLTQKEREVLCNLQSAMSKAFKSKPTLRILSGLLAKGLIEWDCLGGTGKLTEAGEQHLR